VSKYFFEPLYIQNDILKDLEVQTSKDFRDTFVMQRVSYFSDTIPLTTRRTFPLKRWINT